MKLYKKSYKNTHLNENFTNKKTRSTVIIVELTITRADKSGNNTNRNS